MNPGDCSERKWVRQLLSEGRCLLTEELKELKGCLMKFPIKVFCTKCRWQENALRINLSRSNRWICWGLPCAYRGKMDSQPQARAGGRSHGTKPFVPRANTGRVSAAVTMVWPLQEGKEAPLLASPWTPGVKACVGWGTVWEQAVLAFTHPKTGHHLPFLPLQITCLEVCLVGKDRCSSFFSRGGTGIW